MADLKQDEADFAALLQTLQRSASESSQRNPGLSPAPMGATDDATNDSSNNDISTTSDPWRGMYLAPPESELDPTRTPPVLQPLCQPITRMMSDFQRSSPGRLVSVNENYICYSIKSNLIRVIHLTRVTRNKLPAHSAPIADMAFPADGADLLASVDTEGGLKVRHIFELESSGPAPPKDCMFELDVEISLGEPVRKLAWWGFPNTDDDDDTDDNTGRRSSKSVDGRCLVVAVGDRVALLSGELLKASCALGDTRSPASLGCLSTPHAGPVADLDVSPTGQCVVSVSESAEARVWALRGVTPRPNGQLACTHCFLASTGFARASMPPSACSILCLPTPGGSSGEPTVLVGEGQNRVLRVWSHDGEGYRRRHEVDLRQVLPAEGWSNVVLGSASNEEGQHRVETAVAVTSTSKDRMALLHLDHGGESFDGVHYISLKHPVLSMVMMPKASSDHYELFCLQTEAVQKFKIALGEVTPPKRFEGLPSQPSEAPSSVQPATTPPPSALPQLPPPPPQGRSVSPTVDAEQPRSPPGGHAEALPVCEDRRSDPADEVAGVVREMMDAQAQHMERLLKAHQQAQAKAFKQMMTEALAAHSQQLDRRFEQQSRLLKTSVANVDKQASSLRETTQKLDQQLRRSNEQAARAVASEAREPIAQAFRQCFVDLLVPAMEQGTQKMFSQMNQALEAGLQGVRDGLASAEQGSRQAGPARTRTGATNTAAVTPEEELGGLIAEQKYDEAMMKALGAQSLPLVTWLCGQLDSTELFDRDDSVFSQTTLLCLLQQLGQDLQSERKLKLAWVKDVSLHLETSDASIRQFAPNVVAQVKANVKKFSATDLAQEHKSEIRLILGLLH